MGKRRNTAKTGDRAASGKGKQQPVERNNRNNDDDDDPMYTKIDRYHNQKEEEFLKLDNAQSDSEEEEKEAVMDLGLGGDDDDSDASSDEPSDDEDSDLRDDDKLEEGESDDEDAEVSVSSSEDEEEELQDVRNWGRNKKAYYHGDTADLEIGQEIDDAYLEEEAAKEVQRARYEEMSDDDFELSDSEEQNEQSKQSGDVEKLSSSRDVHKLSAKERKKLLDKQHPEMLPLMSYFSDAAKEFDEKTNFAARALFEGEKDAADAVGATTAGKRYLLAKAMLQASSALNLTMYLLLKKEDKSSDELDAHSSLIQSHPVMARLQKLNSLSEKLEEYVEKKVPGLAKQLANIAEAAKLVGGNSEMEGSTQSDEESVDPEFTVSDNEEGSNIVKKPTVIETASSDEEDQSVSTHESAKEERRVQTEARFGLRHYEINQSSFSNKNRKRRAVDFGEIEAVDEGTQKAARQSLAATLNTIEQKTSRKKASHLPDTIDETQEADDALRRGIEMMEEELGKDFDKNSDDAGSDGSDQASFDPERDSDDEMGFYEKVSKKSKMAKADRKARYAVAPKFPRMDSVVEGERAINSHILKNRGLVAHKAKINRNPRVKKRMQYKKALVRRKGAVREIRQDEGHKYGGESTGIKTKVSRSRKLA